MRLLILVLLFEGLTAASTAGQDRGTPAGWSIYPSANVGVTYDDNLFFRRNEPSGGIFYTSLGLNIDATHRGRTSSFRSGYGLGGEYFSGDDSALTQIPSDQNAYVRGTTTLGRRNSLDATASYTLSRNPNRVFRDVDLELGRRRAEGYSAGLQFSRQLTPTNSLDASYSIGYQKLDALRSGDTPGEQDTLERESLSHQAGTSWTHSLGETTSGTLQYSYRRFDNNRTRQLDPAFMSAFQSHVVNYGWSWQLAPRTAISLGAGPNFYEDLDSDGPALAKIWRVTPQANFSFNQGWETTSLTVSYARAQRQFVGSTGSVITDNVTAQFGVTPSRRLSFTFSTGAARNSRLGEVFETYRAGVSGRLEITRWWSVNGNYRYTNQDRGLLFVNAPIDRDRIIRNTAYLGMTIGKTLPLE